jgi:hypothetical protein
MMYYTVKKPILEVINLEKEYFSSVGFGKKSVSKLSMTLALNYICHCRKWLWEALEMQCF